MRAQFGHHAYPTNEGVGTIRHVPLARRGTVLFAAIILIALSACTGGGSDGGITIPTSDGSPPELSLGAGVTGGGPNVSVDTGGSDAALELRNKAGNLNLLASGKDPESGIKSLEIWINETTGRCASAGPCSTGGPDLSGAPRFDSTDPPKQPGDKTSASSLMAQALNLSSEIPGAAPPGGSFSLRWDIYATSTNYLDGTSQTRTITVTYHDPPLPPSPPPPPPPPPGLAAAPSAPIDTYGVGKISEPFVDTSRPTRASGNFPGAATRKLPTAIYYPASLAPGTPPGIITPGSSNAQPVPPPTTPAGAPTRYPLVLFSHGLGASPIFFENLIAKWVSAGYVVAAPEYPLTNMAITNTFQINPDDAFADAKNQPADAKFVIDEVIKLGQQTTGPLGGIVHSEQIGAAGHSLGGITTYGLAYTECCRDPRIKAAVSMSACAGYIGGPAGHFTRDPVPLLILHGDADTTLPYDPFAVEAFTAAKEPKFGFRFVGANHNSPFTGAPAFAGATDIQVMAVKQGTIDHWDRYLKNDTAASQKLGTDFNVARVTPISPGSPITPSNLTPCR